MATYLVIERAGEENETTVHEATTISGAANFVQTFYSEKERRRLGIDIAKTEIEMTSDAQLAANFILNNYKVSKGRIVSPGKFQGERWYMPHFYDLYLNGFAYDNSKTISVGVDTDDKIAFPELKRRMRVRFRICDQGFVSEC